MSLLRQPTGVVATHGHPHGQLVVGPLDASPEVCAPEFVLAGYVTQRLERNRNLNRPAVGGQHAFRLHDDVGIEIFALTVSPDAVSLDPKRIEIEFVGLAAVIK